VLVGVSADNKLRCHIVEFMQLELKAVKWYGKPAKCYMTKMVQRMGNELQAHDVLGCCINGASLSSSCSLIEFMTNEKNQLIKHMYGMPSNHGGIPVAFLEADDSMHFSLDDDGFEVVEVSSDDNSS